jgi:hypothetical protein
MHRSGGGEESVEERARSIEVAAASGGCLGNGVWGLGFRVGDLGFRAEVLRVEGFWGSGFRSYDSGFRVEGLGFGVQGSEFRIQGL